MAIVILITDYATHMTEKNDSFNDIFVDLSGSFMEPISYTKARGNIYDIRCCPGPCSKITRRDGFSSRIGLVAFQ